MKMNCFVLFRDYRPEYERLHKELVSVLNTNATSVHNTENICMYVCQCVCVHGTSVCHSLMFLVCPPGRCSEQEAAGADGAFTEGHGSCCHGDDLTDRCVSMFVCL